MKILLKIADIGVNHDAAILIKTDDISFFNQNDCKIFDRLGELDQDIDFYSVQFSGANAHPSLSSSLKRKKLIYRNKSWIEVE